MVSMLQKIYSDKTKLSTLTNHLIVIYSFFLPLSKDGRKSTFFILLFLFLINSNLKQNILTAIKNPVIQALLILFSLHLIMSIGVSDFPQAKHFIQRAKILLYPMVLLPLIEYRFLPRFFTAYFLGMIINELTSYSIFFGIISSDFSYYKSALDPTPLNYSHLGYGYVLTLTIGLLIYQFTKKDSFTLIQKALMLLFITTATVNVFVTGGRIGYVLYMSVIFTVMLFSFRQHILKVLLASLVFLTLVFTTAYTFSPIVQTKVLQTKTTLNKLSDNDYESSFGIRLALWKMGIDLLKEKPVLGVGTGQHMKKIEDISKNYPPEFTKMVKSVGTNIHNGYLEMGLQFGIVGFLSFCFIFYRMFTYKQEDNNLKLLIILLASSTMVYSIVSLPLRNIPGIVFVSLLSFALVQPTNKLEQLNKINIKEIFIYFILIILFFIIGLYT